MAVEGWLGPQGEGKTYCLVCHCVLAKLAGNDVYSNLVIAGCGHFDTWDELMFILESAKQRDSRVSLSRWMRPESSSVLASGRRQILVCLRFSKSGARSPKALTSVTVCRHGA